MTSFAIYNFQFGLLKIGYDGNVVTYMRRLDVASEAGASTPFTDEVFAQVQEYLTGRRREFDFAYRLEGTDFQKKVWKELCRIGYGETRTYKQIAVAIGKPNACRAVGMANHNNPVIIAVPCHRVIGANGKLIGYAAGLEMKAALIKLESDNNLPLR